MAADNNHPPQPEPVAQPAPAPVATPVQIDDMLQRMALSELLSVVQMMRACKLKILAMGTVPEPQQRWIFEEACAIAALVNEEGRA